MVYLVGLVLFGLLAVLQSTIVSTMPLLNGTADLILLFITAWALQDRINNVWIWCLMGGIFASLYTALPFGLYIAAYLLCALIARVLKRWIWKAPFLAMLAATFVGTLVVQILSFSARTIAGVSIPVTSILNLIVLPSLLLNLLLAIPIYSITRDMANWLYPEELKV